MEYLGAVTAIYRYPVKSMARENANREPIGLRA
jgi:uncharacterized protein YcbX